MVQHYACGKNYRLRKQPVKGTLGLYADCFSIEFSYNCGGWVPRNFKTDSPYAWMQIQTLDENQGITMGEIPDIPSIIYADVDRVMMLDMP